MNVGSAPWMLGHPHPIPPVEASVIKAFVIRLRLIGRMEAWTLTSENVLPVGRKARALLAMVALSAPRPISRSRLAETLWSRRPEEQARASLRQEIHRLLDALSPAAADILAITRDHLSVRPGTMWVDVEEVLRATPAHPAALALLDGELLEDLDGIDGAFDSWLASEREQLRDRARTLAEALLRDQTTPDTAISAAQQLLVIDRTHEGAWRAIMTAHAARGERGMAVEAFERCRATLADQRGSLPSAKTQELLAEIRRDPAFVAPEPAVRAEALVGATFAAAAPPAASATAPDRWLPDRSQQRLSGPRGGARVGVLPLRLAGTTPTEEHLSLGLADEITTALARFRWMFLVSSASLALLAEQTRDETAIRRAFGLDFVLDGTIQRDGERLRVSLRLIDLRAGNQMVWSRRFDRPARDLLTLQDEIASEVVAQIDPEILLIEAKRVAAVPSPDPTSRSGPDATAYDLMLRALPLMSRLNRPEFIRAGAFLTQAVSLEPDYAAPHAWFAYWHVFLVAQSWAEDPKAAIALAGRLAERAVMLDPHDARALTIAGHVRAFLDHRLREAMALHERALSLNPNLAMAWNLSGMTHAYLGNWDEAERRIGRYKRLSPLDPHSYFYDVALVFLGLIKRDYEAAVVVAREVVQMNPLQAEALKPYLAALGHLGRTREAAAVARRLLSVEPEFTVQRFLQCTAFERPQDREHYAAGLRLSGLPEG